MERKGRRMYLFFLIYFFFWMAYNTLDPYLGVFYESKGLSGTQIGMVGSFFSVGMVVAAIISGSVEDRIGRPSRMISILLLGVLLFTAMLYMGRSVYMICFSVFLYGCCNSPINGIVDKVLLDELQGDQQRYSFYRTGGTTGAGAGVILAGILVKSPTFFPIFILFWLLMGLCGLCARNMPQEHLAPAQRPGLRDYIDLAREANFGRIYITLACWGFTESSSLQLLALYITEIGLDTRLTSVFIAVAMVGEFLAFICTPRLQRKLSYRQILALAFLLQVLRVGSLTLLAVLPLPVVILLQLIGGGSFALIYSTITGVISQVYPAKVAYSAQTLKLVFYRGIGMPCGTMLLGALLDVQRITAGYWVLTAAACAAMVYYLLPLPHASSRII